MTMFGYNVLGFGVGGAPVTLLSCECIVLAGGGSSAISTSVRSGGGGGGGYVVTSARDFIGGVGYTVTVGAGGGLPSGVTYGTNGGDSTIVGAGADAGDIFKSRGGGGGGVNDGLPQSGGTGGGGGASSNTSYKQARVPLIRDMILLAEQAEMALTVLTLGLEAAVAAQGEEEEMLTHNQMEAQRIGLYPFWMV